MLFGEIIFQQIKLFRMYWATFLKRNLRHRFSFSSEPISYLTLIIKPSTMPSKLILPVFVFVDQCGHLSPLLFTRRYRLPLLSTSGLMTLCTSRLTMRTHTWWNCWACASNFTITHWYCWSERGAQRFDLALKFGFTIFLNFSLEWIFLCLHVINKDPSLICWYSSQSRL